MSYSWAGAKSRGKVSHFIAYIFRGGKWRTEKIPYGPGVKKFKKKARRRWIRYNGGINSPRR